MAISAHAVDLKIVFFRGKSARSCQPVLKVLKNLIIQITLPAANHANQMVVVFAAILTFELFKTIPKIDLGPPAVCLDDPDGLKYLSGTSQSPLGGFNCWRMVQSFAHIETDAFI